MKTGIPGHNRKPLRKMRPDDMIGVCFFCGMPLFVKDRRIPAASGVKSCGACYDQGKRP